MERDKVINMAKQAGIVHDIHEQALLITGLHIFANLVADSARKQAPKISCDCCQKNDDGFYYCVSCIENVFTGTQSHKQEQEWNHS